MNIGSVQPINGGMTPGDPKQGDKLPGNRLSVSGTVSEQTQGMIPSAAKQIPEKKEDLQKAIDGMNLVFEASRTHLKFKLHDGLGEYYVQIVDDRTEEVIREVPPKKVLDMVAKMWEMAGLLVDERR
jgi:flagellar protein FlaG